jgi:threonine/homoserine/homoserine lactone efflux protein
MISLILGIVSVILGCIGLGIWGEYFLKALKAVLPILLVLGGLIAVYGGYTSIKDKEEAKKEEEKAKKEDKKEKKK